MNPFDLSRNDFGKLVFISSETGQAHAGIIPVRAFPISAPESGISLVDADGHELTWIERLGDLPAHTRALIEEELANREFLPEISKLRHVSTFATPSTWKVETDRGIATFVLRGEEDIRRIGQATLLIADSHGVQFLIRDLNVLDKASRRLLDRFL